MTSQSHLLAGQVALITGASRGIGRAIAIEFARAGANVALLARAHDASPSRVARTGGEAGRTTRRARGGRGAAARCRSRQMFVGRTTWNAQLRRRSKPSAESIS